MTWNNSFELVVKDLEIERTTIHNLRVRLRKRAEKLKLELEVT